MKKISFAFLFFILLSSFSLYMPYEVIDKKLPVYYSDLNQLSFSYTSDYLPFEKTSNIQFGFDSLTIPIKRVGNLILIETVIDGQSGNLIFDSGSVSELVLNKTYFRNYKKRGSYSTTGINGAIQDVEIIIVDSLNIAEMIFEKKYVEITDLSQIENRCDVKILGFFGLKLINNFEIVIDIYNNELQLFSLNRKGNRINSIDYNEKYDYSQEIEILNNVIFIRAEIAGKKQRFCFDTAAEKNIISHIASKKTISSITITGRARLIDAGSRNKEVLYGKMNDFMFGEKQIKNMEALIADISALNNIYETFISGVLGYDFLIQGKFFINTVKKNIGIIFYKEN